MGRFWSRLAHRLIKRLGSVHVTVASASAALPDLPLDVLLAITHYMSLRDVLVLLETCKSLRAKLVPVIDTIAKQHLTWALPLAAGEQSRWNSLVKKANVSSEQFPWLSYARKCYESPSMRNRQRIRGICRQLEQLAIARGVL